MKGKLLVLVGILLLVFVRLDMVRAEGKVSSYLFGDYAYIAQSSDTALDGKSGFVVRRIYFTFDNDIADNFAARVRLEMSHKDLSASSSTKMEPFVKDAYVEWKFSRHSLYAGLSGTPTWGLVEKFWGYRWLEKTPLDLHRFGSTRDMGLALKGHLDEQKRVGYHLMVAHGASAGSETDKGKKYYASLSAKPSSTVILEIYGDYEDSEGDKSNTANYVLQGFAGIKGEFGRAGVMYAFSSAEQGSGVDTTIDVSIISGFVVVKLNDRANGVVRVDYLADPNPSAHKVSYLPMVSTAKNTTFALAGIDFQAARNVHVQPNIEVVFYGDDVNSGTKPDEEIIPRVSIYYKF